MNVDPNSGGTVDLDQVGNRLRVVVGRIVRRLRQGQDAGEVTLSELSVLSRLDRCGPVPAGVLAEQERVSPQSMSSILAMLEQRGLVTRTPDTSDGRRVSISTTPNGQRLLVGRRSRNAHLVARALEELDPAERRQLMAAIPLLERLAERL